MLVSVDSVQSSLLLVPDPFVESIQRTRSSSADADVSRSTKRRKSSLSAAKRDTSEVRRTRRPRRAAAVGTVGRKATAAGRKKPLGRPKHAPRKQKVIYEPSENEAADTQEGVFHFHKQRVNSNRVVSQQSTRQSRRY